MRKARYGDGTSGLATRGPREGGTIPTRMGLAYGTNAPQDARCLRQLPCAYPRNASHARGITTGEPYARKRARTVRREAARKRTQTGTSPRGQPYSTGPRPRNASPDGQPRPPPRRAPRLPSPTPTGPPPRREPGPYPAARAPGAATPRTLARPAPIPAVPPLGTGPPATFAPPILNPATPALVTASPQALTPLMPAPGRSCGRR